MDDAADRKQKENVRPLLGKVALTRCNAAYHSSQPSLHELSPQRASGQGAQITH
jgi:hypothetical protein